ncbi:MAG: Uncharacterized conserved protein, DUF1800 family [Chloroflexi bacterium]|nr:MAG: Uncharacterized conserved protein, DUF1800 family [Chloroflexota bacterium]
MADDRIDLMAHLMRRVGVGANRDELEQLIERPYEEVVEELLHPGALSDPDQDLLDRYLPTSTSPEVPTGWASRWIYNLANGPRPLREKMALFWHHVFATGYFKSSHARTSVAQIALFRENGLGNMRQILRDLSRDPAMIDWLDNSKNHAKAVNENYGRELLELFSMGIGSYTEDDVKAAARAFTGWTFTQPIPIYPYSTSDADFAFDEADHDSEEKTFLGQTVVDGDDVIDVIVKQDACARFICRHLYNFFVADEPQVPSWNATPPRNPDAIDVLVSTFVESDGDIRQVMRTLLNANFFKAARFRRVKSPVEFVGGAIKLAGVPPVPNLSVARLSRAAMLMGQELMNPPSVEGWHTGQEWLDSGTLTERVNFAVEQMTDTARPGIASIVRRVAAAGDATPEQLVDRCLDLCGPIMASPKTRATLIERAEEHGSLSCSNSPTQETEARIGQMLRLIVAAPEYQFA